METIVKNAGMKAAKAAKAAITAVESSGYYDLYDEEHLKQITNMCGLLR